MGAMACEFAAKTTLFLSLRWFPSLSGCLRRPGEREPRETRFEELELFGLVVLGAAVGEAEAK